MGCFKDNGNHLWGALVNCPSHVVLGAPSKKIHLNLKQLYLFETVHFWLKLGLKVHSSEHFLFHILIPRHKSREELYLKHKLLSFNAHRPRA